MRKIVLSLTGLVICFMIKAQTSIADEEFISSFSPNEKGATVHYQGKSHAFTLDIVAKEVKTTDNPGFYLADNHIVQVSTVPLPPVKLDLSRLTDAQQKQALSAYVDYEMTYFQNKLKLKCNDLKKDWIVINSRLFLLWHFNMHTADDNEVKQQIYLSTICFNQVLDLNTIVLKGEDYPQQEQVLKNLANTLKTFDKAL